MKNFLLNIFIGLSVFVGTIVTFILYLNRRLALSESLNNKITTLMEEIAIEPEKQQLFLIILSIIYCIIFFILGFVIYKIIFKLAGIKIPDGRLIIAIGSGYMLSYLAGYFMTGNINDILLVLLTNVIEIFIVFFALHDYIKNKLLRCSALRSILLLGNLVLAI